MVSATALPQTPPTAALPGQQHIELRPYQKQAIAQLYARIRAGYRAPLLYAPTGSGKTVLAARVVADALSRGHRVLFLVHRDLLVEQTRQTLIAFGISEQQIGFIKAGYPPADASSQVIVASIQSQARRELPAGIGLVVVDECHRVAWHDSYHPVEQAYLHDGQRGAIFVGLTATPWRTKRTEYMGQHFDAVVQCASIKQLIQWGYLAQPRYFGFGGIDVAEFERGSDGDYKTTQVQAACLAPGYNERVRDEFLNLSPERTAIAFCSGLEQSRYLAGLFNGAGIAAEHLDGNTPAPERQQMYRRLEAGTTRVLCSVGTLTEGFDVKSVGAVILARPTRSHALLTQMAGRGLRPYPGKDDCCLLDFGDNFRRLGFLSEQPAVTLEPPQPSDPALQACPSCGALVAALARICPECGCELTGEGDSDADPEDEDGPDADFEAEFGELFPLEQRDKVTYLRKQRRQRFTQWERHGKQQNPDRVWELYWERYQERPRNSWLRGALFGRNWTEANRQRLLRYLCAVSPVDPPRQDWLNFHIKLELGELSGLATPPGQTLRPLAWYEVLDVDPLADTDWEAIKRAYRQQAKRYHPDTEGSDEQMKLLNQALDEARQALGEAG